MHNMERSELDIIESMGRLPDGLTEAPNSEMAGWRLLAARVIRMVEQLMGRHAADIDNRLMTKQYGTGAWYKNIAMEYQHGDSLAVSDVGIPFYSSVDVTKRIVAQCAVSAESGLVRIKVARLDGGVLSPLSAEQMTAFQQYMQMRMPIGLRLVVVSAVPDRIQLHANVGLQNTHLPEGVKTALKTALKNYQTSFEFNGEVAISDIYKVFNSAEGVAFSDITTLGWYAPDFGSDYTPITRINTYAGYFNFTSLNIRLLNGNDELLTTITAL